MYRAEIVLPGSNCPLVIADTDRDTCIGKVRQAQRTAEQKKDHIFRCYFVVVLGFSFFCWYVADPIVIVVAGIIGVIAWVLTVEMTFFMLYKESMYVMYHKSKHAAPLWKQEVYRLIEADPVPEAT